MSSPSPQESLIEESLAIMKRGKKFAAEFYQMKPEEKLREITAEVIASDILKESLKQQILESGRRFFLFRYPSDGFWVKGTLSFVPDAGPTPLLLHLRGGNKIFSLPHPASVYTTCRNYTVLSPVYRGGVSEGIDEYGGEEVNDVKHALDYFPELQKKLKLPTPSITYMLGGSRGGMELFLALARSPALQQQIAKAASLSGLVDLHTSIRSRTDLKEMLIEEFGLPTDESEIEWINHRDPLQAVPLIRKDLPFLIVQGTADTRVSLVEGLNMVKKLQENGNLVTYLEVPEGSHCLTNQDDPIGLIADWFET